MHEKRLDKRNNTEYGRFLDHFCSIDNVNKFLSIFKAIRILNTRTTEVPF